MPACSRPYVRKGSGRNATFAEFFVQCAFCPVRACWDLVMCTFPVKSYSTGCCHQSSTRKCPCVILALRPNWTVIYARGWYLWQGFPHMRWHVGRWWHWFIVVQKGGPVYIHACVCISMYGCMHWWCNGGRFLWQTASWQDGGNKVTLTRIQCFLSTNCS